MDSLGPFRTKVLFLYLIAPVGLSIFVGICSSTSRFQRTPLDTGLVGLGIGVLGFAVNFAWLVVIAEFDVDYFRFLGTKVQSMYAVPYARMVLAPAATVWRCLRPLKK